MHHLGSHKDGTVEPTKAMTPLLFDPDPKPPDDDGQPEYYFVLLVLVFTAVVIIGQMFRGAP